MPSAPEAAGSIPAAYAAFLLDRRARGVSPDTLRHYSDKLGQFVTWAGARPTAELTAGLIRAYLVGLAERGLGEWTVHGAARAVRAFCRWLVAEGALPHNPMPAMPHKPRGILPPFTTDEVTRLVDAAEDARDRAFVLVLLDSGLRVAELCRLEGRDVNLQNGRVNVRRGKGAKPRVSFLGTRALGALLAYFAQEGNPEPRGPVFRDLRGRGDGAPLNVSTVQRRMRAMGAAAGVEHATPHRCRRTFALLCLRSGMSVFHLQRLMGHEDVSTLQSYLALVEDDIQAAHRAAAPVDRLPK